MPQGKGPSLLLRTTDGGRWVWWAPLQLVEFMPKGKRHAAISEVVDRRFNNGRGAYRKALKLELDRTMNDVTIGEGIPW